MRLRRFTFLKMRYSAKSISLIPALDSYLNNVNVVHILLSHCKQTYELNVLLNTPMQV